MSIDSLNNRLVKRTPFTNSLPVKSPKSIGLNYPQGEAKSPIGILAGRYCRGKKLFPFSV